MKSNRKSYHASSDKKLFPNMIGIYTVKDGNYTIAIMVRQISSDTTITESISLDTFEELKASGRLTQTTSTNSKVIEIWYVRYI